MVLPDTGRTNIVPVDYVVDALVAMMHTEGRDGQTFHLTAPKAIGLRGIYRGVPKAAGLPPLRGVPATRDRDADRAGHRTGQDLAQHGGHPTRQFPPKSSTSSTWSRPSPPTTRKKRCAAPESRCRSSPRTPASCGATGPSTSTPTGPAATIRRARWWVSHVIITGASSGIGRASAIAVAERGATVFALARNAEALDELIAEIRGRRRTGARIHMRRHRLDVGRTHGQGHPRPVRARRLSGQQRGTVDPPLGVGVHRPSARLRTRDGRQLLRCRCGWCSHCCRTGANGGSVTSSTCPARACRPAARSTAPTSPARQHWMRSPKSLAARLFPITSPSPASTCRW